MKKFFVFFLMLLLLMPAASATDTMDIEDRYQFSPWALGDVKKAMDLGIAPNSYGGDLREPVQRSEFAEKAASLVAIEFGSNLENYLRILWYRGQVDNNGKLVSPTAFDVAKNLGIIQGRGDDGWDAYSSITRQEAAVMLARTYRAYQNTMPDTLKPLSFFDQSDIADWALEDVQLMNHLGIMTGNEWNCFEPQDSYTIEQCLVTLLRLHEKAPYDGSKTENPFVIPVWEKADGKNWGNDYVPIAIETKEYYIYSYSTMSGLGPVHYYIDIIDQDLVLRTYHPVILISSNSFRGQGEAMPENAFISEDGTKLFYTATVAEDTYHYDVQGKLEPTLLFLKGVYTVTMDLKTGEQTWARTDFPES